MEVGKLAHKARAASASDTESDLPEELTSASPSSLGKRAQDDALEAADNKKPRVRKGKEDKHRKCDDLEAESDALEADSDSRDAQQVHAVEPTDAEQAAAASAVLSEAAQPVDMVITSEEAAGLNAAVAAAVEAQEQVQVPVQTQTQTQVPPPKPRKGRRVRKTNLEKMEILAFVDQGGSQGAAAEKFGVSRTAVTKMVKERAAISAQALVESATSSRKVLQYQHKLSVIEDMLYKWQMQIELDAPALKITGDLLQSKAMEFRNKILADYSSELSDEVVMSLTDFKASNGWLHRYMQRRSMRSLPKQHTLPGDGEAMSKEELKSYTELLERLTKVPALQKTLGLDFTDNPGQFMVDLVDFDKSEAIGTDEVAKDNEIVVESLAAQGLLRDTHRALMLESIKSDDLPMLTVTEANSSVSRLLHFMSQDSDNLLTLAERRTGRANLLILQRLLMKARDREREREATTDFTV
ncbi:hypothetical protein PF002_g11379 [Phytophthora fragariae]|uniref:HTH CENPB-type domain-containing protein n=1 Tax=Phytophthora fragariae TaxID=53985 RepID=A0A6A3ZJ72_9STRA|nr:hypothetical protein PF002_g11379 [Phytophthora fragariae]